MTRKDTQLKKLEDLFKDINNSEHKSAINYQTLLSIIQEENRVYDLYNQGNDENINFNNIFGDLALREKIKNINDDKSKEA